MQLRSAEVPGLAIPANAPCEAAACPRCVSLHALAPFARAAALIPPAAQFGLKSSVKSRKLSTAGESDALCRTNIAIFHLTAGCSSGRNVSPKPRTSGSAIEGQITAPCRTRSIDSAVLTRCTGTISFG